MYKNDITYQLKLKYPSALWYNASVVVNMEVMFIIHHFHRNSEGHTKSLLWISPFSRLSVISSSTHSFIISPAARDITIIVKNTQYVKFQSIYIYTSNLHSNCTGKGKCKLFIDHMLIITVNL